MEYFTVGDISNQGFYPIPEKLFNNKQYQKKVKKIKKVKEKGLMVPKNVETVEELLSDTSKLVYGVMCRYLNYSLQNGWFDKERKVYIKLSVTTLAEMLNKSRDTIIKCKKQLEAVGLLEIIKAQHQSDTFYLGKVKDRPEDDVLMEVENRIKSDKNLEVESIDQSKVSDELVESIDLEVVESIDPIRVLPIRDNKRVVAEIQKNTAAFGNDFSKNLKEVLSNYKIRNLNSNSLKNIKDYSEEDINLVRKAIEFIIANKKPLKINILVAILRDRDFEKIEAVGKELTRNEKISYMTSKLGKEEIGKLRTKVLDSFGLGYDGEYVDKELGNILCRRYSKEVS